MHLVKLLFLKEYDEDILQFLKENKICYKIIFYDEAVKIILEDEEDNKLKYSYVLEDKEQIKAVIKELLSEFFEYLKKDSEEPSFQIIENENECPEWVKELIKNANTISEIRIMYNQYISHAQKYNYVKNFTKLYEQKKKELMEFEKYYSKKIIIESDEKLEKPIDIEPNPIQIIKEEIEEESLRQYIPETIDELEKEVKRLLKEKFGDDYDPRDYFINQSGEIPKRLADLGYQALKQAYNELIK